MFSRWAVGLITTLGLVAPVGSLPLMVIQAPEDKQFYIVTREDYWQAVYLEPPPWPPLPPPEPVRPRPTPKKKPAVKPVRTAQPATPDCVCDPPGPVFIRPRLPVSQENVP